MWAQGQVSGGGDGNQIATNTATANTATAKAAAKSGKAAKAIIAVHAVVGMSSRFLLVHSSG